MDKLVDFSQQLVAVLPGGGRHPATFIGGTIGGHSFHVRVEGYGEVHVGRDGHSFGREIIIRNAAQAHSAKPSTPSNEELTQRMEIAIRRHVAGKTDLYDDRSGPNITVEAEFRSIVEQAGSADGKKLAALRDAAWALVQEIGEQDPDLGSYGWSYFQRARKIKADLPKPVDPIDPDLIEARKLAHAAHGGAENEFLDGERDHSAGVRWRLEGIKLGRTLAAGGTAHE